MADLGFWAIAADDPGHLALVEADGRKTAAGDLLAVGNQVARGLQALGLQKGDVVAALLPNTREMLELALGATQIGLYITPINYHLTGPEVAYIVDNSEAKVFVASERYADVATKAVDELGFDEKARYSVGAIDGFRSYDELKDPSTDAPDNRTAGATMHYTSGTTGKPKGVRRPLGDVDPDTAFGMASLLLSLFGIQPKGDNVHLVPAPLYHTAAMTFGLNSLHMGHTVVLMDKWGAEPTLEMGERYKCTTSHMVPTMFHRMLALPEETRAKYDVSSWTHFTHAAAPCPVEIKKRMLEWWGPTIYEYYAATEGGGTLVTPGEWVKKPGTVGKPWPISEVKILDDDFNEVAANDVGTVWMSMGADRGFEYYKDKDKTDETFRENFFTVGDAGYLDDDGFLFLVDRKSDMIISGGVNIYPAEIESVLLTHPKVGDAAVFGIPHDDWGEEVKAVVEPAQGIEPGPALAEELMEFCTERLAKYKLPKTLDFVAELPRDPNGKLYKRKLRDPYWAGREKAI
jgi:long-chain acyl-CoA synthetase